MRIWDRYKDKVLIVYKIKKIQKKLLNFTNFKICVDKVKPI